MADPEKFVKTSPFSSEGERKIPRKTIPAAKPDPEPVAEDDLLGNLAKKKPAGKNFTVYLDLDVVEEADNLAKKNGLSRSTVINSLLKKILLDK